MAFWAGIILYFSVMFLTFVLYTLMCLKHIGRPLFTVKSTVEETVHFTWAGFRQHHTWIFPSKHTLKVEETWLPILPEIAILASWYVYFY